MRPGSTGKSGRGMAGRTVQAGRNMGRHGIHLTFRGNTIVAGSTIINDAGMIEGCRHEAAGGMTDATILVSVDMVGLFGCGETGVMTGHAVIHDAVMIEACRYKTRGHVTVATVSIGRHMEVGFAGGGNTIMTARTVIHDTLVLEPGVGKRCRCMAHRAILGGCNVGRIDFRVLASGIDTIVAGRAVIHDTAMVEHRRLETAACYVADAAILGGCNVGRIDFSILAGSGNPVMAGITACRQNQRIGVVDIECGTEIVGVMATTTIDRGCRMWRSGCLASGSKRHEIAVMAGSAITGDSLVS